METASESPLFDASRYSRVSVADFEDQTKIRHSKQEDIDEHVEEVAIAGRLFADKIAAELRVRDLYAEVTRGDVSGEALVIGGSITCHEKGNAAARLMIGLGAGSSYFDASVQFNNNSDGEQLASLIVDKNSWFGEGWAAGQTVEAYMDEAANKIADELERAFFAPSQSAQVGISAAATEIEH